MRFVYLPASDYESQGRPWGNTHRLPAPKHPGWPTCGTQTCGTSCGAAPRCGTARAPAEQDHSTPGGEVISALQANHCTTQPRCISNGPGLSAPNSELREKVRILAAFPQKTDRSQTLDLAKRSSLFSGGVKTTQQRGIEG